MSSIILPRYTWPKLFVLNKIPSRFFTTVVTPSVASNFHNRHKQDARLTETLPNSSRSTTHVAWKHINDQPLSARSLSELLGNKIPAIRVKNFLSEAECTRMANVVSSYKIGSYNKNVFPAIGSVGITQFDFKQDKSGYLSAVKEARVLQQRFAEEAGVSILKRVQKALEEATGIPVRIAAEGDREYFAGLLRVINSSALIHADYAPYDAPSWEVGQVVSQISWNVLLKQVQGGETIIYNRPWQGRHDDESFKKPPPSYGYQPIIVQNKDFKVVPAAEGDLTLINSRNFHEVRQLDRPEEESRYTVSSFVGLLPPSTNGGPELVMWS